MILNSFNSLISANSTLLEQANTQVRNSVEAEFKTQIYSKLPTKETIKQQFLTEAQNISTQEDLENIENLYNRLKGVCESLLGKVDNKITQLNSIKEKTAGVTENFNKLEEAVGIATPLVQTAKGVIQALKGGLFALGGIGSGGAIVNAKDGIDAASSKIKEFDSVIAVILGVKPFIEGKIQPINTSVDQAIGILQLLRGTIEENCAYLDALYLWVLSYFTDVFTEIDDDNSPDENDEPGDDGTTSDDVPDGDEFGDLGDILNELNPNFSREIIQYLESEGDQLTTPDGGKRSSTGYRYKQN